MSVHRQRRRLRHDNPTTVVDVAADLDVAPSADPTADAVAAVNAVRGDRLPDLYVHALHVFATVTGQPVRLPNQSWHQPPTPRQQAGNLIPTRVSSTQRKEDPA